jgi:hypothetical protein
MGCCPDAGVPETFLIGAHGGSPISHLPRAGGLQLHPGLYRVTHPRAHGRLQQKEGS